MIILILGAVFMLAVCIFIHELGHLLCGMLVGVKARIFSIGYGKGVWKKRINGTTYQITGIPLGGYVMFKGDEYGKRLRGRPGELLSTPPLKRMIPVLGGPLFNLILGFIIFFCLALVGDNTPSNRIFIDSSIHEYSAAYKAGLRSGDRIVQIDGKEIKNFEDIFTAVGLSGGEEIELQYLRAGQKYTRKLIPDVYSAGGRPTIGVEPAGKRNVVATFTTGEQFRHWLRTTLDPASLAEPGKVKEYKKQHLRSRAIEYLKDGDVILQVEGKKVSTVGELQRVLGNYQGKEVRIQVERKLFPLLTPWATEITTTRAPVRPAFSLDFFALKESKFPEFNIPSFSFASYDPELRQKLLRLKFDDRAFQTFTDLSQYLRSKSDDSLHIQIGKLHYDAKFQLRAIGLLGFRPSMKFRPDSSQKKVGVWGAFVVSAEKVYENIFISLKGLGMLLSGMISPRENLSGPIGIVQFAGMSLEYGWYTYFDFVAKISIALMFMNLLPIPVADGGHLVLYLYEAISGKPLPMNIINIIFRVGFFFLLLLGILVSINDITRFF